jgi:hypothetical protein
VNIDAIAAKGKAKAIKKAASKPAKNNAAA